MVSIFVRIVLNDIPNIVFWLHILFSHNEPTLGKNRMEEPALIRRILVVDDEYAIRILLKSFLESQNYEIRLAEDGSKAIQLFQEFQPELIISDIMMPTENGLSIVSRIREIAPSVKVIYLSAWLDEAETERRLLEELARFPYYKLMQKPFNLHSLLETIQELSSAS